MRHRLILLVITAIGILSLVIVDRNYSLTVTDDNTQYLTLVTARTQDQLTADIQSSVDALESLRSFMLATPDLPDYASFDNYASQLLDMNTNIRTFQYVDTDRIIRHMYPLEGNEAALNLDLTTRSVASTVERAILERITNVNNPLLTVQGSLSIVVRSPLYRDDEFIGLVQVIVDIETLIENVFQTIPDEFDVQLSDARGRIFWGSEMNASNVQLAIIPVADSTWTLSVCWRDAPSPSPLVMGIIWGGGSILLLTLLFSVNQSLQQMINLRKEVDVQTASLTEKNAELLAEIAERKRAEGALLASERRFSHIFEVSPVATAVTRLADTQFSAVNDAMEMLSGYTRDELLGKTSLELNLFVDPLEREGLAEKSADARNYKGVDIQLRNKSGDILDVLLSSDMIELNDEMYAITMALDVTERKRAESTFQRHLREEQLLYVISMELHDLQDTNTLIQRVVNILDNILYYPYTAVLLIDHDSGALLPFAISDQGQGDQFVEIDKAYISSNGIRLGKGVTGWVAQTGQSIRTGNVTEHEHYLGLRKDIHSELCLPLIVDNQVIGVFNTESEQPDAYDDDDQAFLETVVAQIALAIRNTRLRETLHESEEKFRNLFENASDAIFLSNSEGYHIDVNTRACKLLGYTRDELIGNHMSNLVASENLISQPLKVAELKAGKLLISERMLNCKDGRTIPVEISSRQLPDGNLLGMVRDITERKQAEQLLQKYNQRLTILHQIDKNIILGGSSETIVDSVLKIIHQMIDCERATVVMFDEQAEEVVVLGTTAGVESVVQKGLRVSVKGDSRIAIFKEGKTLLVQDTIKIDTPTSDIWDNLVNEGIRSFLVTPLIMHGNIIGSLNLLSKTANFFTSERQEIITEIADQLTIGLYQVFLREELAENEQRFRLLAENAIDIIFRFRLLPNRGFEYISPSATSITGYTPEEFYADDELSFNMVHPDDRSLLPQMADLKDVYPTLVVRWIRKDGNIIWTEQHNTPIYDDNGAVIAFEGIARDITARQNTLEALKLSEIAEREQRQFAEALRDSAAALTTAVDLDNVMNTILKSVSLVVPNDAANIMLIEDEHAREVYWAGYQPEQIEYLREISFPISDTANLHQMFISKLPTLISDIDQYLDWVHIPLMDWARSYVGAPIRSHGQVIGFLNLDSRTAGFYTKIHAQRLQSFADQASLAIEHAQLYEIVQNHAQELERQVVKRTDELQRSETRYRAIIEDQTDLVCRYVSGGILTFVNQTYSEYSTRSVKALLGESRFDLVLPDERQKLEDHIASLSFNNPSATIEIRFKIPNEQSRWLHWSDRILFDDEGNFLEYQSVGRDITERKVAENQLQQMLEHAMNLSELRSRYISMAAHDLRNPLAVIQSSVNMLQHYNDRLTDERKQTKYDQVDRSIKAMVIMLDDVLTLGQADAGKLKFAPSSVDVKGLCEDIIEEVIQYTNTPQQIEFSSQGDCSIAYLDTKLVRHILSNLFSNAIKYSPENTAIIFELNCSSTQIVFRIQDHGIGIPKVDQKRLFETFHRASNAKSISGTGLGLAIVKQSVESHGGAITFESQENVGTTFIVALPHNPQYS